MSPYVYRIIDVELDMLPAMREVYETAPKPAGVNFEIFCDLAYQRLTANTFGPAS